MTQPMSFADRCLSNAWDEAQAENESRRRSEYVKCTCLWHETYPDERMVGNTDCPAHGDDVDGSMHDLSVSDSQLADIREAILSIALSLGAALPLTPEVKAALDKLYREDPPRE